MRKLRNSRLGYTRISAKKQVTIPTDALGAAGLEPGDVLRVAAAGAGRIVLEREPDVVARHVGRLTDVYAKDELDRVREEWR
jgi:bifunctional DNA-binding transcriptional regulator/antitoxin component of YhaV-PrlF toxin-antitoxin module